jgi:hypothetical protein
MTIKRAAKHVVNQLTANVDAKVGPKRPCSIATHVNHGYG